MKKSQSDWIISEEKVSLALAIVVGCKKGAVRGPVQNIQGRVGKLINDLVNALKLGGPFHNVDARRRGVIDNRRRTGGEWWRHQEAIHDMPDAVAKSNVWHHNLGARREAEDKDRITLPSDGQGAPNDALELHQVKHVLGPNRLVKDGVFHDAREVGVQEQLVKGG